MKASIVASALALFATVGSLSAQVTTSQYDNMRTGATMSEKILSPENVNAQRFGKLGAFKVDGAVYAQPLFVPGVEIPGRGKHDVLFVVTEHDSVYAFDAERPNNPPLWQVSFLNDKQGMRTVAAQNVQCPFIVPELGITSTPVIDLHTGTLYVVARTKVEHLFSENEYAQHLHALAITTGVEKFGGPKLITASVPGQGTGASNGRVAFDPLLENPRASLLLANHVLYLSWASSCDVGPYHGWVMAYNPETLAQVAALNLTPDGGEGGIWQSDTGPAADEEGNVYVSTGNGTFDASSGGRDFGDSVIKLHFENSQLVVRDYFTPYDQASLNQRDADLGSSGPTLLPGQPGPHRQLLLQPSKGGRIYVIDRDTMGQFHAGEDAIVQTIGSGRSYCAMAYWNGHAFFVSEHDSLRDYLIKNGQLVLNQHSLTSFDNPGATPSVSSDGQNNAVVWAVATRTWNGPDRPAVLFAFAANDIAQPIYSSEQNSHRDRAALATRFVIPVVANGRVYFGTRSEVEVYGLLKN
jgi:hypothetical protein